MSYVLFPQYYVRALLSAADSFIFSISASVKFAWIMARVRYWTELKAQFDSFGRTDG